MRKYVLFLTLYFCLCLLAGCAAGGSSAPAESPADAAETETNPMTGLVDAPPWFVTVRIVDGADTGCLLLAEQGKAAINVYTLSFDTLSFEAEWASPLRNGQLINVYFESVAETWPLQFAGVSAIEIVESGFDDRCALYLRVLEDLWAADSGLNSGVETMGVDLTETSLNPAERSAVAWAFAERHGAELLEDSLQSLMEQGVITAHPLTSSGSGENLTEPKHYFYEWENGIHFSIVEQETEGTYSLTPVTFTAQKWRSSLGAYWFIDCTAVQSALGEWSGYTAGAEMIS